MGLKVKRISDNKFLSVPDVKNIKVSWVTEGKATVFSPVILSPILTIIEEPATNIEIIDIKN